MRKSVALCLDCRAPRSCRAAHSTSCGLRRRRKWWVAHRSRRFNASPLDMHHYSHFSLPTRNKSNHLNRFWFDFFLIEEASISSVVFSRAASHVMCHSVPLSPTPQGTSQTETTTRACLERGWGEQLQILDDWTEKKRKKKWMWKIKSGFVSLSRRVSSFLNPNKNVSICNKVCSEWQTDRRFSDWQPCELCHQRNQRHLSRRCSPGVSLRRTAPRLYSSSLVRSRRRWYRQHRHRINKSFSLTFSFTSTGSGIRLGKPKGPRSYPETWV